MTPEDHAKQWSKEAERLYRRYYKYKDERAILCSMLFEAKVIMDRLTNEKLLDDWDCE